MMDSKVYDRVSTEIYFEKQYKEKQTEFLYNTLPGRVLLRLFVVSKTFSRLQAFNGSGKRSIKKIRPFIEKYQIDMTDYGDLPYKSFNDFFARKMLPGKRAFSASNADLIAVADSKLTAYSIDENLNIHIKKSVYTVEELTGERVRSAGFGGGTCLVFRLTVDDYHRYCFFDSGKVTSAKTIKGCLHTVGPVSSKRYKVYNENFRIVTGLLTDNFGHCMYIEVGALLVGKIINHQVTAFNRGDEKGYFLMGGSTIVILLKADMVKIDDDILLHSGQGIETKVKMGEKIGLRIYD
jgi:phosphatidylserine decarboxylase